MRNAVREYIDLSTEEKKELWKNATFVFDTNVFLNLYRYTKKTRDLMFKAFSSYKNRIWMPNHVAHEIMENRCEIIHETNARYDVVTHEMETFLQKCCQELRLTTKDEEYIELQKYILDWIKKNEKKNNLVVNFFKRNINNISLFFNKYFVQKLKEKELLKKILFTLSMMVIFVVIGTITLPGISISNSDMLNSTDSFMGILNTIGGGGLRNFSLVSLGRPLIM